MNRIRTARDGGRHLRSPNHVLLGNLLGIRVPGLVSGDDPDARTLAHAELGTLEDGLLHANAARDTFLYVDIRKVPAIAKRPVDCRIDDLLIDLHLCAGR